MLKNIIIVNDFDYIQGGASKVAIQTANLLKKNYPDLNIYFFSAAHDDSSILDKEIINISTNQGEALKDKNKIRGFFNGIYNRKAKKEFEKIVSSLNIEETIIHVHGWTKCLSSSIFQVAFNKNIKLVLTMHDYFTACPNGGYFNYKNNKICHFKPMSWKCLKCNCDSRNYVFKVYRILRQFVQNKIIKLNKNLTNVISISEFSEKILKTTLNKKTNIFRVYNPIDIDIDAKKVDIRKNDIYLYVGRISKEKGVDIFCKAISELELKGIVVGDGNQKQVLQEKYNNIEFAGWKNSEEVKEYMKKARVLVFPSRWYEGAPLTPLEAFQYGIPCITSDNCSSVDIINNSNGLTFNIERNNLKDIIIEFNNNIEKYCNFSFNYNKYANYIKKLINVYNLIMENHDERKIKKTLF